MKTLDSIRGKSAKPHVNAPGEARQRVYAALDLGTNNCRLLVATPEYREGAAFPSLKILDSYSRIVRLGEGLGKRGNLSEDAMGRTIKALRACRVKLDKYPGASLRFIATEACRRASNGKAFLKQVQAETGMRIEIISNEEEAKLAFYGCSSLIHHAAQKALTFDIGGGSTEFMWASMGGLDPLPDVIGWGSIPHGVMNLSERFGGTAYTEMYFDEIVQKMQQLMAEFDHSHHIRHAIAEAPESTQLLSTSGTVTTLAAIHLDLPRYDRTQVDGVTLDMRDMCKVTQKLLSMSPSQRYNHPCIGAHRSDYILSGCAILEAIHSMWGFEKITIADRGVREGVIIGMALNDRQ